MTNYGQETTEGNSVRNTPCTEAGFKVGDKFRVLGNTAGFTEDQIVTLFRDDGSDCPLFRGANSLYRNCEYGSSSHPGAYLFLKDVSKIEEFKTGDRVSISNIECDVLQKKYKSGEVAKLLWETSRGYWECTFERDGETWMIGGECCDITPAPPIPAQVEMRRVITTITMTQDVPFDDFQPEYATIEDMQMFLDEIIYEDLDEDLDIVVTRVSVELVDNEG